MMKVFTSIVLFFAISSSAQQQTVTESILKTSQSDSKNTNTIKVGMGLPKPPYIIEENYSGIELDIVIAAFKEAGIKVEIVHAPQARGLDLLKTKNIDALITMRDSASTQFYYSDVYIKYKNVIASLKKKQIKIEKLDDLRPLRVVAFQNAKILLGPDFEKATSRIYEYREIPDQTIHLKQLANNRVDAVIGETYIIEYFLKKLQVDLNKKIDLDIHKIFPENNYKVAFNNKKLRDQFNLGLAKIKAQNFDIKVYKKYGFEKPN